MSLSRRELLHLVVLSTTVTGAAFASGCSMEPAQFGLVPAGNTSTLSVGDITPVAGASVFIARDASGVYAMTTTCTHAGCDLSGGVASDQITCPCHGSVFDANGNVLSGPAPSPLVHYAVAIDASGDITINGAQQVDASDRVTA
jgi:Rieske Fe-S protein